MPSDETRVYFIRVKDTGAVVGLFWSSWNGLDLLIPRHIDPRLCEAAEISQPAQPAGGIIFAYGPVLHEGAVENLGPHRCMLTDGLARMLFDNGDGELAAPIEFVPLHQEFDLAAAIAEWTDEELLSEWKEVMTPWIDTVLITEAHAVIRAEMQRRGLPLEPSDISCMMNGTKPARIPCKGRGAYLE